MLCGHCHEREATVRLTRIADGDARTVDVCAACAGLPASAGVSDLLAEVLGGCVERERVCAAGGRCPGCGIDVATFVAGQRLGCERCYGAFAARLEPLLAQMQPHETHRGKIPARSGSALRAARDRERLRAQLEEAIRVERYERAAELRDRLRALDADLERGAP